MSGIIGSAGSKSGVIGRITDDVTISADISADNYDSLSILSDVDDLTTAGLYNCSYAAANVPSGSYNWTICVIEGAGGTSVCGQLAIQDTGASRYTRCRDSGSWSAWSAFT